MFQRERQPRPTATGGAWNFPERDPYGDGNSPGSFSVSVPFSCGGVVFRSLARTNPPFLCKTTKQKEKPLSKSTTNNNKQQISMTEKDAKQNYNPHFFKAIEGRGCKQTPGPVPIP